MKSIDTFQVSKSLTLFLREKYKDFSSIKNINTFHGRKVSRLFKSQYFFSINTLRGGCKSLHRDYDGTETECEEGNSKA